MFSKDKIKAIPSRPGVYIFKDRDGRILYIGKAVDLRKRVSSYFGRRSSGQLSVKMFKHKIDDVEFIVTDTEKEALLLENTMIKENRPRYNIDLKDDKTYVHIRIGHGEDFPGLSVIRRPRRDGARYFGPYDSARAARKAVRFLQKLFLLRDCGEAEFGSRVRPCIKYEIKRCSAPCRRLIPKSDYARQVSKAEMFLSGRANDLLKLFGKEMEEEASNLNYERAARLRDTVEALRSVLERQKAVVADETDRDAVGVYLSGGEGEIAVLCARGGRLIGSRKMAVKNVEGDPGKLLSEFLTRYYMGEGNIPSEILLTDVPEDAAMIESALSDERGSAVKLLTPRRGEKKKLVELANSNAEISFGIRKSDLERAEELLEKIRKRFRFRNKPLRIECVDISNIAGSQAVGSIVAFTGGKADRTRYRGYTIRTVKRADDPAMMYEVLTRRLRRGVEEGDLPDLVVLDGGRAQLGAAGRALSDAGIQHVIDVIAVAKGGEGHGDRVYIMGSRNPVSLKEGGEIILFLQRVRDEAHRFAISFHRRKRDKALLTSQLESIKGIGRKRANLLLRELSDIESIEQAEMETLFNILKNRGAARSVRDYFAGQAG